MKRRLNTLKGKRLVTGDSNLMTKDEICINTTPNGVEVKEIGTDGKIKDLAGSSNNGGGGGDNITTIQQFLNKYKNLHVVYEIASGSGSISKYYGSISRYKILNMEGMTLLVVECHSSDHGNPIVFDNNVYEEKQKYDSSVVNRIETFPFVNDMYIGLFSENMLEAFNNGILNTMFIAYVENLDLI